jgi:hypothetical protein
MCTWREERGNELSVSTSRRRSDRAAGPSTEGNGAPVARTAQTAVACRRSGAGARRRGAAAGGARSAMALGAADTPRGLETHRDADPRGESESEPEPRPRRATARESAVERAASAERLRARSSLSLAPNSPRHLRPDFETQCRERRGLGVALLRSRVGGLSKTTGSSQEHRVRKRTRQLPAEHTQV